MKFCIAKYVHWEDEKTKGKSRLELLSMGNQQQETGTTEILLYYPQYQRIIL